MAEADYGLQKALVFYLDGRRRVLERSEVAFNSRCDLIGQLEASLDRYEAIEVWQGDICVLCLKAHGSIETNCGKPASPTSLKPCC